MKKLLLLAALVPISYFAHAQQAKKAIEPYHIRNTDVTTSAKSTIAGSRWYNHAAFINSIILPNQMKGHLFPIWYDSSVLQNYTTGLAPIEYISAAQIVNPQFALYNDINTSPDHANDIAICEESIYMIDSVSFMGAYIKNPNRPANVVDTLIFSVSPTSTSVVEPYSYYATTASDNSWAANYVNPWSPDSVLKAFTIDSADVDIANRASNVGGRILWKIPLTDADRQLVSGDSVELVNFTYPVMINDTPNVCHIAAGYGVAITITFKSGDIITPGVDTFSEYHHLFLWSGEAAGDITIMPYYFYAHNDRNMSSLMGSGNDSVYHPSIFLEGNSDSSFAYEFHGIDAHLVCLDCTIVYRGCGFVGTSPLDIAEAIQTIYPNPANQSLTISFAQPPSDDVSISIINAIGQVMSKRDIDKGTSKITLSTAELPEGIYFYIIRTNGEETGGRFTVLH